MIKYIGSKRLLAPTIAAIARVLAPGGSAVDLFSGTTRVAQALKEAGLWVHANDTAWYSEVLARCYVGADARTVDRRHVAELLHHLDTLPPRPGYFTETFCVRSRYVHPSNGARVDAIRDEIDSLALSMENRAIALASLLEAADRVDSTTGLQMAYLKEWAPRALGRLQLRMPRLLDGGGDVSRLPANDLAGTLPACDLAYVDPPYNQHSYRGNYHVWETLVRNDRPEVYGVACKRTDCRVERSPYNSRRLFLPSLSDLLFRLKARWVLLSCSSEGYLSPAEAVELLRLRHDSVGMLEVDFRRYVGAQIGIHNRQGEKVGRVSHLRNREFLVLAGPEPTLLHEALRSAAGAAGDQSSLGTVSIHLD